MDKPETDSLSIYQAFAELARDDPQAFEARRSELIEDYISGAPERIRHRLRQLQFRLDGIRRLSGSPLGTLLKIQALMWESFLKLDSELQRFARFAREGSVRPFKERRLRQRGRRTAQVVEFRPRALPHRSAGGTTA